MPILGDDGQTAIQSNGQTYIDNNPTRTAYNNAAAAIPSTWKKPKPTPVPKKAATPSAPPVAPSWNYTPSKIQKPLSMQYDQEMGVGSTQAPSQPTAFDKKWNPTPAPALPTASKPLSMQYDQEMGVGSTRAPTAPTAFDNQWNPAYDPKTNGNVPLGKLNNIYNPVPESYVNASQNIKVPQAQPSFLDQVKDFFTPKMVDSKATPINTPSYYAPQNDNGVTNALKYLVGGLADVVGLGPDNKDEKKAPDSVIAQEQAIHNQDSGLSPYTVANGQGFAKNLGGVGKGIQDWWNSSDKNANGGNSPSSSKNVKPISPNVDPKDMNPSHYQVQDSNGNWVAATPTDLLYSKNIRKTDNSSSNSMADFQRMNDTIDPNAIPSVNQENGTTGSYGTQGFANNLNATGQAGAGSGYDPSLGGSGVDMAGMPTGTAGSSGGMPTDSSGMPSFLQYGLTDQETQALQSIANSQAYLQNQTQRNALDYQANQTKDAYKAQVDQLNNQQTSAEQQLENQSFQDYLNSRQQIADRGLASSGLANDANTRLMLSRNDQLGQLERQNTASLASALNTENTNLTNIGSQRQAINDQVTANNLFNQLYTSRLQSKQQANQLAEDWAKWNTTSGNYAYRYGMQGQIAQMNNATKMQVAQMNDNMKLQVGANHDQTQLQSAGMKLQSAMASIQNKQWNYAQQSYVDSAKALYLQADEVRKQIANAASPQDAQTLTNSFNQLIDEANQNVGMANSVTASGGSNFNYPTGGSGAGGFSGQVPNSYAQQLNEVVKAGYLNPNEVNAFNQIIKLESSFDPNAKNPSSTAYGYGQFLNSTRAEYEKKMNMSYNNPINQLAMTAQYIHDRYGTAQNALNFHYQHGWY